MKILRYDVLAILLSLLVFLFFTWSAYKQNGETGYLLIESMDAEFLYPLSEDREIHVKGPVGESIVEIHNGEAKFTHSDCSDELCVQMGSISGPGEWAACLPNEVFLSTTGNHTEGDVDAGVY
ncbi:MAG: hypothetical protein B6241_10575 [Spirochaetaceae bacterium 4572_59]|nr:MAG: hypothetical protein B6241_10575 [Spirochaetaceae bacterium 4572_59]